MRSGITCRARYSSRSSTKHLRFYVIDALKVARESGMGGHINTVMQVCFFAISGVLPRDEAIDAIKHSIDKTYGKKGEEVVEMNLRAVDQTLDNLYEVSVPAAVSSAVEDAAAGCRCKRPPSSRTSSAG